MGQSNVSEQDRDLMEFEHIKQVDKDARVPPMDTFFPAYIKNILLM